MLTKKTKKKKKTKKFKPLESLVRSGLLGTSCGWGETLKEKDLICNAHWSQCICLFVCNVSLFSKTSLKKKKNIETQNAGTQYKGAKESVVKLGHICGQ